jgi:hypothetical protein
MSLARTPRREQPPKVLPGRGAPSNLIAKIRVMLVKHFGSSRSSKAAI